MAFRYAVIEIKEMKGVKPPIRVSREEMLLGVGGIVEAYNLQDDNFIIKATDEVVISGIPREIARKYGCDASVAKLLRQF